MGNLVSDLWGFGTGVFYQGLSIGADSTRVIPAVGIVVGSALDTFKGVQSYAAGNYRESIVSASSVLGGGVGGFVGGALGSMIGGPLAVPLSIAGGRLGKRFWI